YWGCSSRTQRMVFSTDALPETTTYLPDFRLWVHHPAGWQVSEFTVESGHLQTLYPYQESAAPSEAITRRVVALSTETITAQTIRDYYAGQPTPPMFVATELDYYLEGMFNAPLKFMLTGQNDEETA